MYADEIEALLELEQALRWKIALRIAQENELEASAEVSEALLAATENAIAAWSDGGEDDADLGAFRPLGPLQQLLADHRLIVERIADLRDRRLS